MFLRKSGSALAIMALALLVAVAVSMTSVANYVGSQPGVLAGSVRVGGSYLILGRGADGLIDSRVDSGLVGLFSGVKGVSYVFPQRVFESSLHTGSGDLGVRVRAVDRLGDYLRHYGASVRGSMNSYMLSLSATSGSRTLDKLYAISPVGSRSRVSLLLAS